MILQARRRQARAFFRSYRFPAQDGQHINAERTMADSVSSKDPQATLPDKDAPSGTPGDIRQKVELDLDDAPFLEDEEEPEQERPSEEIPEEAEPQPVPESEPQSLSARLLAGRKKIVIAGMAAVVLIIVAVAVNFILPDKAVDPAPTPAAEETPAPPPPPPSPTVFLMEWEPFWVEMKDTEGAIRFLRCKVAVPTENPILFAEMQAKRLVLRDAVYYYLRNQPALSLSDKEKVDLFKNELLTVLNEHLGSGKVAEVLIQDYIVQ